MWPVCLESVLHMWPVCLESVSITHVACMFGVSITHVACMFGVSQYYTCDLYVWSQSVLHMWPVCLESVSITLADYISGATQLYCNLHVMSKFVESTSSSTHRVSIFLKSGGVDLGSH